MKKKIGISYNNDGSVTVVYKDDTSIKKMSQRTLTKECWEVIKGELTKERNVIVRHNKSRRDIVRDIWTKNPDISFGALITGAMEEFEYDTEDMQKRTHFAGLINEMNERGEIKLQRRQLV